MKKIILSPPFSNLFYHEAATNIVGTYTLNKRKGLWRVLTRLKRIESGWINDVGLRNPGISKLKNKAYIVSISELEDGDWSKLLDNIVGLDKLIGVEFNISCPNLGVRQLCLDSLARANDSFDNVIVKLPHYIEDKLLYKLLDLDCILHVSNSRPTNDGAVSGSSLVFNNLKTIHRIKKLAPSKRIIAGGGIYDLQTIIDYNNVGADHFSLSTALLNPNKACFLIESAYKLF